MSTQSLPTLSIRAPLNGALADSALATLASDSLADFLLARRWFGGKARRPGSVRFRDTVPLFDGTSAVARLDVDPDTPAAATYQLPLAVRPGEPQEGADGAPRAVLARVESADGSGFVFDALEDESFRRRLGEALSAGASFRGPTASWVLEPVRREATPGEKSRLASGEQSNTSILYGKRAILKIYRRLAAGENPDVEIAEFLERRAKFPHVPRLLGTIRFQDRDGTRTVAGLQQALVENRGDGWAYALERVRGEIFRPNGHGERPFAESARRLGEITRELHQALASAPDDPAFAPVRVSEGDLENWGGRVALQVKHAGEILAERAASGDLTPGARVLARDCLAHLQDVPTRIRDLVASLREDGGSRIRHHGDYHLGQVLVTPERDFVILDFEGEPARPIAERRERHSPLRDVAGMLRSFSYAAAVGGREHASDAATTAKLRRWDDAARGAFLSGYFGTTMPSFLPQDRRAADRLLALFETEKVFYELAYELNNRPDWVEVPLAGIARLVNG